MSRTVFWSLVTPALALALAFRLAAPGLRPMHHDEANQAVKFGALLETGEYRYDRHDHHGPTLYYLTLPSAWARGQATLASLDEATIRAVPAIFGAGLILLFALFARGLGRPAAVMAGILAAISPGLTYYSRFYIQESALAFFAIAFVLAVGRFAERHSPAAAACAGLSAGLAFATKETSVIALASAVAACLLAVRAKTEPGPTNAQRSTLDARRPATRGANLRARGLLIAAAAFFAVTVLFYSSFFRYPSRILEPFLAFTAYAERAAAAGPHVAPWYEYLRILTYSSSGRLAWSEGLILALAAAGLVFAVRRRAFWPLYVGLYSILACVAFSAIPYKTPWNVLPFHAGFALLGGYGAATLLETARTRPARLVLLAMLGAAAWQLGLQNVRASFRYPADPRNPYVYAHTSTDFLRLVRRVEDLATLHPDRAAMLVKVVAGPYEQWPTPWYLRRMTRVGYWPDAAEAAPLDDGPVVIASQDYAQAVDSALGDRYVSEFYGLRPGVLLTLYIERTLWERLLESRQPAR